MGAQVLLNLARGLRFDQALVDIKDAQSEWEKRGAGALREMERLFSESDASVSDDRRSSAVALMTAMAASHADAARDAWWRLADALMAKFADVCGAVGRPSTGTQVGRGRGVRNGAGPGSAARGTRGGENGVAVPERVEPRADTGLVAESRSDFVRVSPPPPPDRAGNGQGGRDRRRRGDARGRASRGTAQQRGESRMREGSWFARAF